MSEALFATFTVAGLPYALQFVRLTHRRDYAPWQNEHLAQSSTFDVSFRLDGHVAPDGELQSGYHITGTGHAFQVLGGVANGLMDWAQEHQPEYLHWHAVEPNRRQLYNRMVKLFHARGSGYLRLPCDPFTGRVDPGEFWLSRERI